MPTSFEAFSEEIRPRRLVDGPSATPVRARGAGRVRRWALAAVGDLRGRRRGLRGAVPPALTPGGRL